MSELKRACVVLVGWLVVSIAAAAPAAAQAGADTAAAVRIVDLTPRFLTFYDSAVAEGADEERRWELWKELYDFAAVPPLPERDSLARAMLATAWPLYPDVLARIRAGVEGMDPPPDSLLAEVAHRLDVVDPVDVTLLVFVGDTRSGAYFAEQEGQLVVALPIEEPPEQRERSLVHELTHAVHHHVAGLSGGWERSVARTILEEGLATRMEQALMPGRPVAEYVEHRPGWFAEAEARHGDILRGIVPHLRDRDSEAVARFTVGTGTTGLEREAYYAGWVVAGHLLADGHAFRDLARVPEAGIPALVEEALEEILGASRPGRSGMSPTHGAPGPGGTRVAARPGDHRTNPTEGGQPCRARTSSSRWRTAGSRSTTRTVSAGGTRT